VRAVTRIAHAVVVAAVVVALAACTGSSEPAPTPAATGALDAYLVPFSWDDAEFVAAQELEEQELIAACMAEQGFEYVPYVAPPLGTNDFDPPRNSREYAVQFGYGFTEQHPDESGSWEDYDHDADPNFAIRRALTPGEAEAYDRAIDGPPEGWSYSSETDDPLDADEFGCRAAARSREPAGVQTDATFIAARDRDGEIWNTAAADPRVTAALARWSSCMADAGWTGLEQLDDPKTRTFEWEEAAATRDAQGYLNTYGEKVAADERAIATADWDCRTSSGYDAWFAQVRNELQQAYVDDHRAELDAMLQTWQR